MPHDGVGPNLPFLHQKMQPGQDAFSLWLGCLDEQTHTSLGAGTRDVNLLDGEVAGREGGFPDIMVLRRDRSIQHKQAI
jgi:hypothetical protein